MSEELSSEELAADIEKRGTALDSPPDDGGEWVKAAEGPMTFEGFGDDPDPWMEERLDEIGRVHGTGKYRGRPPESTV